MSYSPLACTSTLGLPRPTVMLRGRAPWGLLVHVVPRSESAKGIRHVVDLYRLTPQKVVPKDTRRNWGPGYVVGLGGELAVIAEDEALTWHAGLGKAGGGSRRDDYLDGTWRATMRAAGLCEAVERWDARWEGRQSPSHLYPGSDPNRVYIGVELLALSGASGEPTPAFPGAWFTAAQIDALVALAVELAGRWSWPKGWEQTARLLGHEDVDPMTRADARGLWDPGAGRERPRFDWNAVRAGIWRG